MEDQRIIQLLFDRAELALTALSEKFGKRLFATAKNILENDRDAEESVSDTYLAIWNAIPPACPDPLAGYVLRVGKNTALKHLRRRTALKRQSNYELSLDELGDILPDNSLEEAIDARLLGQAIDRFLDTLSPEQRHLFLRRYWFGDSIPELARQLHLTQNTVSVRLHRIRTQLRTYLNKEGFFL